MTAPQFPAETFPRQHARTRRFSLGRPRTITVADDGSRVVFLRSRSGDDPAGSLWVIGVDAAEKRLIFGPEADEDERVSDDGRGRRERRRETLPRATDSPA